MNNAWYKGNQLQTTNQKPTFCISPSKLVMWESSRSLIGNGVVRCPLLLKIIL